MSRIFLPIILLCVALASFFSARYFDDQDKDDLPESSEALDVGTVTTPVLSARRIADVLAPASEREAFIQALSQALPSSQESCISVTRGGTPVYEANRDRPVNPGDSVKLLTAATALTSLGPDHLFTTEAWATAEIVDGVIDGDVYLVGGGDPLLLETRYLQIVPRGDDPLHTPIEVLAQRMVDDGLELITGAIVGDATRYDQQRFVQSWPLEVTTTGTTGTSVALQINDGWVQFPDQAGGVGYQAAENPVFHAAALFDDMLEALDVGIRQAPRDEPLPEDVELTFFGSSVSAPLLDITTAMLTNNDHETAEILLKEVGLQDRDEGSTNAGLRTVRGLLEAAGVPQEQTVSLSDGSGLHPDNLLTCQALTAVLDHSDARDYFLQILPEVGNSQTVSFARDGVAAQAGYVRTQQAGEVLAFAVVFNGLNAESDATTARETLVNQLVDLPGQNLSALLPLGPIVSGSS